MARIEQQLCDGCSKVVTGMNGMSKVYNGGILITGGIGFLEVDPDTGWREHYYLTPNDKGELSFCNLECFQAYIEYRLKIAKGKREQRLRMEASGEHEQRLLHPEPRRFSGSHYSDKRPRSPGY